MGARETYVLHIYRSRAVRGWQWAARLEHVAGGEDLRFSDPAALLAHLQALVGSGERSPPPDASPGVEAPASGKGGDMHQEV